MILPFLIFLTISLISIPFIGSSQCVDYGEFEGSVCDFCAPEGWDNINATEIDSISHYTGLAGGCNWESFPGPSPTGGTVVSLNISTNNGSEGIEAIIGGLVPETPYQLGFWWISPTLECNGASVFCCASLSITVEGIQYIFPEDSPTEWSLAELCVIPTSEEISIIIEGIPDDNQMQGQIVLDDAFCSDLNGVCCDLTLDLLSEQEICPNEDLPMELFYTENIGPATVIWDCNPTSGLAFLDNSTSFTPTFNFVTTDDDFAGEIFTFTAFVSDDTCTIAVKQEITVLGYPQFTFDFDGTIICEQEGQFDFPTTSAEGYIGTWETPSINTADYVGSTFENTFTPSQQSVSCPIERTFEISVQAFVDNTFDLQLYYCQVDDQTITLPTISNEGENGTWNIPVLEIGELDPGTLPLVFTPDNTFCSGIAEIDFEIDPGLELSFDIPATLCQDNSNYVFPIVADDGTLGFWETPFINLNNTEIYTNSFEPLEPACIQPYSITITVEDALFPTFDLPSAICRLADPITLPNISLENMEGNWNMSSLDPQSFPGNVFVATWSPDEILNPCAIETTIQISIIEAITADFSIPVELCSNFGVFQFPDESDEGIPGSWTIDQFDPDTITNSIISVFTPDEGLCSADLIWEIEVFPYTVPTLSEQLEYCSTDSLVTLNPLSINGISGTWSVPTFDPSTIGGGTLISTFTPDSSYVCFEVDSLEFTIEQSTVPTFTIPEIVCSDAEDVDLPLFSENGISGSWSIPTIEVQSNSGTTILSIFSPSGNECAENYEANIQILDEIINTVESTNPSSCNAENGQILILGDLSDLEISIDGGITWSQLSNFDNLASAIITVEIRSIILETCFLQIPVTLTAPGAPEITSIVEQDISDCTTLTGGFEVEAVGSMLEYSIDNGLTWQATAVFSNLPAGNYLILVREVGSSDCTVEGAATILDFPSTTISSVSPIDPTDCGSQDGQISIVATGSNLEYSIDGGVSFWPNPNFIDLASGNYQIVVQSQDAADCNDSISIDLSAPDSPEILEIIYEDLLYCEPELVSLLIDATGDNLEYSIDGGTSWQSNNQFDNLSAGLYNILVRNQTKPNCLDQINYNLEIDIADPIEFEVNPFDTDCPEVLNGMIVVLDVVGGFGDYQYSLNGIDYQISNTFENLSPGNYTIFVQDSQGCTAEEITQVSESPIINISLQDLITIQEGESVFLNPFVDISEIDSFKWTPDTGIQNPGELIALVSPEETTIYTLIIYYGECSDQSFVMVQVAKKDSDPDIENQKSNEVFLGNIFSPNGDRVNDYFFVQSNESTVIFNFAIYDRWGNQVFRIENPRVNTPEDGWDGRNLGRDVNQGIYSYIVRFEIEGKAKSLVGTVSIFK